MPSSRPCMAGSTRPVARAAPVEAGTMFWAAARARRRSPWGRSSRFWSLVYAWTVVMSPPAMPKASSSTLTMGTKQLVVHDALDTTTWRRGVELVVVHAHHEGGVGILGRGRDDHTLCPALEVGGGVPRAGETSRRLHHHLDAELLPRKGLGLALGQHRDGFPATTMWSPSARTSAANGHRWSRSAGDGRWWRRR